MSAHFEYIKTLPNNDLAQLGASLVGFEARYASIANNLRLLLDLPAVREWSTTHHGDVLPVCEVLERRHQLVVFEGDPGTGKTETAEALSDRLARDLKREGTLVKLSTRVRGKGLHGQMSELIHAGFTELIAEAGKRRLAFLLIDEADALAARRDGEQMHQEEKAAVNTLIQRLDDLRELGGRAIVFLCTNRVGAIDPAVQRRAGMTVTFQRPDQSARRALLEKDLAGLQLSEPQLSELVQVTGPSADGRPGFTYADMRLKLIPEAVALAFPARGLTFEDLLSVAGRVRPTSGLEEMK